MYHRIQIREFLGFRKATVSDARALVKWLLEKVLATEVNLEHLKEIVKEQFLDTLVSAFCWLRTQEVTDNLVDLLIQIVHRIGTKAERHVDAQLMKDFKQVGGKPEMLR